MTEQTPQQRSAELRRKIEAALAVASAATLGPWEADACFQQEWTDHPQTTIDYACLWRPGPENDGEGTSIFGCEVGVGSEEGARQFNADFGFIAAARTEHPAALRAAIRVLDKVDGWLCEKDAVGARLEWNRALHDAALSLLDALERELVLPDAPQEVK